MFQATLTFAQMRDAPPEALAWLRALLITPHLCRAVMQWFAGALPGVLPPDLGAPLAGMAKVFGAPTMEPATESALASTTSASPSISGPAASSKVPEGERSPVQTGHFTLLRRRR